MTNYLCLLAIPLVLGIVLFFRRTRSKEPLAPKPFPKLSGDDAKLAEDLNAVLGFCTHAAENAMGWYKRKKGPKRLLGWFLRAGVILFTATAGLIPVFAELFKSNGNSAIQLGWSTVFLGFAGLFLAFDKFGGYTSGWTRFMLTELELARRHDEFLFESQALKLTWDEGKPTREQCATTLLRAKAFIQEIHTIVLDETKVWAAEFQAAISELGLSRASQGRNETDGRLEPARDEWRSMRRRLEGKLERRAGAVPHGTIYEHLGPAARQPSGPHIRNDRGHGEIL